MNNTNRSTDFNAIPFSSFCTCHMSLVICTHRITWHSPSGCTTLRAISIGSVQEAVAEPSSLFAIAGSGSGNIAVSGLRLSQPLAKRSQMYRRCCRQIFSPMITAPSCIYSFCITCGAEPQTAALSAVFPRDQSCSRAGSYRFRYCPTGRHRRHQACAELFSGFVLPSKETLH